MKFYFLISFLISLIKIIISKENDNLLVFKFKTLYQQKVKEDSDYNSVDFMNSYILSKVYLEFEAGNEEEFEKGCNQVLKSFINSKSSIFVFRDDKKVNKTFCNFNTSFLESYKVNMLSSQFCESYQTFKINTDFELKKYIYSDFFIENYFCLNDSLCSEVGIDIQTFPPSGRQNFLTQLHKILNSSELNFCLYYLDTTKEEGVFTFGLMPHNFTNKYMEKNMVSFYSQTDTFSINFDTITLNEKEYSKEDEKYESPVKLEISLDKEGIEFDQYFFGILKDIFFLPYIEKGICEISDDQFTSKVIFCHDNQFGINDIKKFPTIKFIKYNINFNITFTGEELFYYKEHKYFCKIYCKYGTYRTFVIGRILLKKYLTVFNGDKKQIYFYKQEIEEKEEIIDKNFIDKYWIIILISSIVLIIIVYLLGFLTGKLVYQGRKKLANELEDNYDYKNDIDKTTNPLYNPKEEAE